MVLTHVLKYLNDNTKLKCSLGVLNRKQEYVLLDLVWWILEP
jgi:hypothetical protein